MNYADRVRETTTTTGTGTYSLAGAVAGFRSFVDGVGDGELVSYAVEMGIEWEVGVGTVTDGAPDTLSRVAVYASSNLGAPVDWGAGTKSVRLVLQARFSNELPNSTLNSGRLTLESGVPVPLTDQVGKTSVRFTPTPYLGNGIGLTDGSSWTVIPFVETELPLGVLLSGTNYDVFGWNNNGALALEWSAAWASDLVRADAITLLDNIYVKSVDHTRRYLGTIRTTSTTTVEDSATKRFVYNAQNRVDRFLFKSDTTPAWIYNGGFRQARGQATNQVEVVFGLVESDIRLHVSCVVQNASFNGAGIVAVGLDSTTVPDWAHLGGSPGWSGAVNAIASADAVYRNMPALGYHKFVWLERSLSGTATFYGTDTSANVSGMIGAVKA